MNFDRAGCPLAAALRLARMGKPVFPCRPNRAPLVAGGFKAATTNAEPIRAWWARWPRALIGMPTGAISGVVVLDLDLKDGRDGLAAFDALRPTLY